MTKVPAATSAAATTHEPWTVGVDIGGTFTDCVVRGASVTAVGKVLTRPDDLVAGVVDSLGAAATSLGLSVDEVLRRAGTVAHGTTVGLNALLTHRGARVGLLTTAGFERTLHLAKSNKIIGLDDEDIQDPGKWSKPALFVERGDIFGVDERIIRGGEVLVPLDAEQARAQIASMAARGCKSVAICLMWAFLNPVHEQQLKELVAEAMPGVPISVSSELVPEPGEYERMASVVINAYLAPLMADYLNALDSALRARGFAGRLYVGTSDGSLGDVESVADHPLFTLTSGPVAGLIACKELASRTGARRLMATDVGGTSFDVGLVVDGSLRLQARPMIERNLVNFPMVDVRSIGTGGGSIAWLDEDLGSIKVGPMSAGANPGPASYGLGGVLPTVTDAVVALGYLEHLAGGLTLDRGLAEKAIAAAVAEPLGMTTVEAAEGMLAVASAQMADLIRKCAHQNGYDAREFTAVAYGGAAAQYAGRYARLSGMVEVVVPSLASVFSAFGATVGGQTIGARRRFAPVDIVQVRASFDSVVGELEAEVAAALTGRRGALRHLCRLRYAGQLKDLTVECGREVLASGDVDRLRALFTTEYERLAGPRSGMSSAIEVVEIAVEAEVAVAPVTVRERLAAASGEQRRRRVAAWFDAEQLDCDVVPWSVLAAGEHVAGPAFVELATTTVVVSPGESARLDASGDLVLDLRDVGRARP